MIFSLSLLLVDALRPSSITVYRRPLVNETFDMVASTVLVPLFSTSSVKFDSPSVGINDVYPSNDLLVVTVAPPCIARSTAGASGLRSTKRTPAFPPAGFIRVSVSTKTPGFAGRLSKNIEYAKFCFKVTGAVATIEWVPPEQIEINLNSHNKGSNV